MFKKNSSRKRNKKSGKIDDAFEIPRGAVAATLQLSANYLGVYSKKAKFSKAIYLHGMTSEVIISFV